MPSDPGSGCLGNDPLELRVGCHSYTCLIQRARADLVYLAHEEPPFAGSGLSDSLTSALLKIDNRLLYLHAPGRGRLGLMPPLDLARHWLVVGWWLVGGWLVVGGLIGECSTVASGSLWCGGI